MTMVIRISCRKSSVNDGMVLPLFTNIFYFFFFTRDVINDGIINAHFREKQNASFRSNDLFFRSMPLA